MTNALRGLLGMCVLAVGLVAAGGPAQAGSGDAGTSTSPVRVTSPDGRVAVQFRLDAEGRPRYSVQLNGAALVEPSPLGLATTLGRWTRDLEVRSVGDVAPVRVGRDAIEP